MTTPFIGEIRMFAFGRVPVGWLACDGSLQSIGQYDVLYTLLGTAYGGDGESTFSVPDLRGQAPVHNGNGSGLSPRSLGQGGGSETVTLLATQIPPHTHGFLATQGTATDATPGPALILAALASDTQYLTDITGASAVPLQANAVTPSGGSSPHDNTMPTLTVSFCIAWAGIFPSQS
jgi:microcystin-dependent protein